MTSLPVELPPDFGSAFAKLSALKRLEVEDMKLMILLETAGEPLYDQLAKGVESAEAKDLLRRNGREETAHAHRLKKAIEIATGAEYSIPSLDENPYREPPNFESVDAALLEGLMQAEFGGDALYQTYAENESNSEIADLLRRNGEEETRHGERVRRVIDLLGKA